MACLATAAFLAILVTVAPEDEDRARSDQRRLSGEWEVTSAMQEGRAAPERHGWRFEFNRETMTIRPNSKIREGLIQKYSLDPSKTPKEIITSHELDPGKPIVQRGIYRLEGDTLQLHIEAAGKAPPTTWDSKPGGTSSLFVLKRVPASPE